MPAPSYLHVPLITQPDGHKLGKSYRAPPLPIAQARPLLLRALRALGQAAPAELLELNPNAILQWAAQHWQPEHIPRVFSLPEAQLH